MAAFVGSLHIDYLDIPIDVSYLHLGIDGLAGGSFLLDHTAIGLKHSHSQLIFSISIDTHEGQNCQNYEDYCTDDNTNNQTFFIF